MCSLNFLCGPSSGTMLPRNCRTRKTLSVVWSTNGGECQTVAAFVCAIEVTRARVPSRHVKVKVLVRQVPQDQSEGRPQSEVWWVQWPFAPGIATAVSSSRTNAVMFSKHKRLLAVVEVQGRQIPDVNDVSDDRRTVIYLGNSQISANGTHKCNMLTRKASMKDAVMVH